MFRFREKEVNKSINFEQDPCQAYLSGDLNNTGTSASVIGDNVIESSYIISVPDKINIFRNLDYEILKSGDTSQIKQFNNIRTYYEKKLTAKNREFDIIGYLPSLHLFNLEDKSILIEWPFHNLRLGFILKSESEKSIWFFSYDICNQNLNGSGIINDSFFSNIFDNLFEIIVRNT